MNDLTIKKDKATIFDSHGPTIRHVDSLEIVNNVLDSITSSKLSYEIVLTVKSTSTNSPSLAEAELTNNATKL